MSADDKFLELLSAGLDQAKVPAGATLVVALSGGPDSTALLAGLAALRQSHQFKLIAAHVNHQIRPDSSASDQKAAAEIAKSLNADFTTVDIDVPALAAVNGVSIESAARTFRYKELNKIVVENKAFGVVTGHNNDDQAETVLQHAARGSGLKGISGMRFNSRLTIPDEKIDVTVLRPMLDTPRSLIEKYCENLNLSIVTDESNASREYTRNKIRLDVLPALNEAIPEATRSLSRLAKNAKDDLEIVDWVVNRILMRAYDVHTGHSLNLERTHVAKMSELLEGQSGTSIELPNQVVFFVDKDEFGYRSANDDDCPFPSELISEKLALPGTTELGNGMAITAEIIDRPERLDAGSAHITFATPELSSHSLMLRNRNNGDRFQPLGMSPKAKLQDFFVGAGVPERWRDRVPIIDSDQGIVWVAGYRLAEWAKVLPEHEQVTRLEFVGAKT
mgnify:CR=1 FL=1